MGGDGERRWEVRERDGGRQGRETVGGKGERRWEVRERDGGR